MPVTILFKNVPVGIFEFLIVFFSSLLIESNFGIDFLFAKTSPFELVIESVPQG